MNSLHTSPALRGFSTMLQGMAFWGAVLLAFSYPAQILAMDRGVLDISMFLVIVTVHILALIVGHNYQAGHSA